MNQRGWKCTGNNGLACVTKQDVYYIILYYVCCSLFLETTAVCTLHFFLRFIGSTVYAPTAGLRLLRNGVQLMCTGPTMSTNKQVLQANQ